MNDFQHPEVADAKDISSKRIDVRGRAAVFVDFAKRLKRVDPDVKIIGTVWTPPEWMKLSRKTGSGRPRGQNSAITAQDYRKDGQNRVDPAKYAHFVQWLVAVAQYHKEQGIPFHGLSLANEPRFSQWYGSCVWTGGDYAKALGLLGEAMQKAGLGDVLLFGPEDMTGHLHDQGTKGMIEAILRDPKAKAQLDVFATHGYEDGVKADMSENSSRRFWEFVKSEGKPYWVTEGGTGSHDWPKPVVQGVALAAHNALAAGNASAFVPWQVSEDEPSTHALAVRDRCTPKTYALMPFSRSIAPGSRRIDAAPGFGDVSASAYLHPRTGHLAIVLINSAAEPRAVELALSNVGPLSSLTVHRTTADEGFKNVGALAVAGGAARLELPAHSVVSLVRPGR